MPKSAFDKTFFHGGPEAPLGSYADYTWESFRADAELMAGLVIQRFQPQSVLDVGCGKGFFVRALCERGINARDCDISEYAVTTSPVADRLQVAALGTEPLPYRNTFDVVTCLGVLNYIQNIDAALADLKRLAGKQLVILFPITAGGYKIGRTREDTDRAIEKLGLRREPATERAIVKLRTALICKSAMAQRRSWRACCRDPWPAGCTAFASSTRRFMC